MPVCGEKSAFVWGWERRWEDGKGSSVCTGLAKKEKTKSDRKSRMGQ